MTAYGNLDAINQFTVVTDKVDVVAANWAALFDFSLPERQEQEPLSSEQMQKLIEEMDPLYRGKRRNPNGYQIVIRQGLTYFEIKSPEVFGFNEEYYARHGVGMAFIGITENNQRDTLIERLKNEFHSDEVDYYHYPDNYGTFTILDTEQMLGLGLCVNAYNRPENPPQKSILPDFDELIVVRNNKDDVYDNWCSFFGKEKQEENILANKNGFCVRILEPTTDLKDGMVIPVLKAENTAEIIKKANVSIMGKFQAGAHDYILLDSSDAFGTLLAICGV